MSETVAQGRDALSVGVRFNDHMIEDDLFVRVRLHGPPEYAEFLFGSCTMTSLWPTLGALSPWPAHIIRLGPGTTLANAERFARNIAGLAESTHSGWARGRSAMVLPHPDAEREFRDSLDAPTAAATKAADDAAEDLIRMDELDRANTVKNQSKQATKRTNKQTTVNICPI